jgi:hypothetical protein
MTEEQVIAIYCFCDDFLKARGHRDWPNVKMTPAEIMVVYIVATRFFYGNIERAYKTLKDGRYIGKALSKGQLNVRLHGIENQVWHDLIRFAYEQRKLLGLSREFIVDSFPISVCRNIRISRCRIYEGEDFRGYNVSKREYFYGLKVNMVPTAEGQPFEVMLCPGKYHDIEPFKLMGLDLSKGSNFYGDSAYTDYEKEEELKRRGIRVIIERKANSCKPHCLKIGKILNAFAERLSRHLAKFQPFCQRKFMPSQMQTLN